MSQTITLTGLKDLLEQEKFEQAKQILEDFFSQPLSEPEIGEAYLNVSEIYLDVANHFARQKKELLEAGLKTLEELEKKEKQLKNSIDLGNIRNLIQKN